MAFSPDGTLLASAGRSRARVWDAQTGLHVLTLAARDWMEAAAFSADGKNLAITSKPVFDKKDKMRRGGVDVWRLEDEPAVRTLRGLAGAVGPVYFSRDDALIAAISHDHKLGVWEAATGRLRFVVRAPQGYVHNSKLCFNAAGSQMLFVGDREARLWDTKTGAELGFWTLAPSLTNTLSFHQSGSWLLLCVETEDGKVMPRFSLDYRKHPRVCRLRELAAGAGEWRLVKEIKDFNRHVYDTVSTADGRFLVIEGARRNGAQEERIVKIFNGLTGDELWSLPSQKSEGVTGGILLDPTRPFVAIDLEGKGSALILNLANKSVDGTWNSQGSSRPFPTLNHWATGLPDGRAALYRGDAQRPILLTEAADEFWSNHFNHAQTSTGRGNDDGTVTLLDLPQLQRRLAEVGLSW